MSRLIQFMLLSLILACESTGFKEVEVIETADLSANYVIYTDSILTKTEHDLSNKLELTEFNGKPLLIDYDFAAVYEVDLADGTLRKVLDRGNGPNELPLSKIHFLVKDDETMTFIGSSADYYVINGQYERTSTAFIDFGRTKTFEEIQVSPNPSIFEQYHIPYAIVNELHIINNNILISMTAQPVYYAPKFNAKMKSFYYKARMFALIEKDEMIQKKMIGVYPKVFPENQRDYIEYNYDKFGETILVNFFSDSLIYVYDKGLNGLYGYGRRAKDIHDQYEAVEYRNEEYYLEEWKKYFFNNYEFYKSINSFDETGLVCRVFGTFKMYQIDLPRGKGIQLYKDRALIGEVSGMNLLGAYQDGKYYATPSYDRDSKQLKFKYLTIEEK